MNTSPDWAKRTPDISDLYADCGAFAGGIYGGRGMVYVRHVSPNVNEYIYVVNGMIVRHYQVTTHGHAQVELGERFGLVGRWAFRAGLKAVMGFRLVSNQTAAVFYHEHI